MTPRWRWTAAWGFLAALVPLAPGASASAVTGEWQLATPGTAANQGFGWSVSSAGEFGNDTPHRRMDDLE